MRFLKFIVAASSSSVVLNPSRVSVLGDNRIVEAFHFVNSLENNPGT